MNAKASAYMRQYAGLFGVLGAVGGFVSDVLQPLAPISLFVFGCSLVLTVLIGAALLVRRAWRDRLLPHLLLSASFLVFSGLFLALQSGDAHSKGVVATYIPGIEQLQASLGLIERDIAQIKAASEQTAKSVGKIEESTARTAEATEKLALSLDAISQGFSALSKSGGIIENATRADEHYHNARVYETRGDYGNARRSYNQFFAFKLDALDPHLRYQGFLKLQEGIAGAREVYAEVLAQDPRPITELASLLLAEETQRAGKLAAFAAAHPDIAPAFYELSLEYSAARKGTQSLADKRAEHAALATFVKLDSEGKLQKFFIDKELAGKWQEDAAVRLKALEASGLAAASPVSLVPSRSNAGWTMTVQVLEPAREIFYRLEGEASFRSTGPSDVKNPVTGEPMPNAWFLLPPTVGPTAIEVKYSDIGNEMQGPFRLAFDPATALAEAQKSMLAMTKTSWLSFRDYDGKVLLYFTQLLTSRCALRRVEYGINSEGTPNEFPLPPCNAKDPYSVPDDGKIYVEVPGDARFASVRLTYADDTQSEVVRIER